LKLTAIAKGRPCMVRLPGCDGGGETTVFAHYRLSGTCGVGMKPPDTNGAFACGHCHDLCDGRIRLNADMDRAYVRLAHAEGVLRTLAWLASEGYEMRRAA